MELTCAACHKTGKMQRCVACQGIFFCNEVCMKQGWPQHKPICKLLKEAAKNGAGFVKVITTPSQTPEKKPTSGAKVTVQYKGYLADGSVFDQNLEDGITFPVGVGQVIAGWDAGIASMAIGEKATLYIAADHAYGARGYPPEIPPSCPLIFDVCLKNF